MILLSYQCSPKIMEIHVKIQAAFFLYIEKPILKFIQKNEPRSQKRKKLKRTPQCTHTFLFQNLQQSYNLSRQCSTARHIDQWSRIESSDTSPYIDAQLVFDKGTYKGPDCIISHFKSIISIYFIFVFYYFSPNANMPVQNPPHFYSNNNKNL